MGQPISIYWFVLYRGLIGVPSTSCLTHKTWGFTVCYTKTSFVSRKLVFEKLFFKLFCVCLSLEKLVNGKHFLVNGKYFPVNKKYGLVFKKVFSL